MAKRKRPDDDEPIDEAAGQNLSEMLGPTAAASNASKKTKVEQITEEEAESKRFLAFYDSLSPDQQRRYEAYRRSRVDPKDIKTLMIKTTGTSRQVSTPGAIVVAGLTKLFVGDIVERARVIMQKRKETGPICPQHLREAYRQLRQTSQLPLISCAASSLRR